jgi:glutathione S-transferase
MSLIIAEGAFAVLDGKLVDRAFLFGDSATIADIACYGEVAFAPHAGLDISACRNITIWAQRLAALPRFKPPFDLLPTENAEIP